MQLEDVRVMYCVLKILDTTLERTQYSLGGINVNEGVWTLCWSLGFVLLDRLKKATGWRGG